MSQENFWILFSKKIAGEASSDELDELELLIRQHPEWQYALQNLDEIWQAHPKTDTQSEEDAYLLHLQRMKEKNIPFEESTRSENSLNSNSKPRSLSRIIYLSLAAAAAIALFVVFILPRSSSTEAVAGVSKEVNEISTRPGSKSRVKLPDGTVVWLNAGSKLIYNKDFGKTNRNVELSGEGFFDVVKNANMPFLIHTPEIDIRVLGTAFNVKAYPEDSRSETSLIRGSIEVSIRSRPNDKIILSPNEKLVVEKDIVQRQLAGDTALADQPARAQLMAINKLKIDPKDSTVAEIQWVQNKLVFVDESFADLATKMERWYGVEIEIADSWLASKRFTGNFENENVEQAIEALMITTAFSYDKKGNIYFIHR